MKNKEECQCPMCQGGVLSQEETAQETKTLNEQWAKAQDLEKRQALGLNFIPATKQTLH